MRVSMQFEDLTLSEAQVIVRRVDAAHAPEMRMPAKRAKDFVTATEMICQANNADEVLNALLHVALRQFTAFHAWCALRNQPTGAMTIHAGKHRGGGKIELDEIIMNDKINQAVEKSQFLLLPRLPSQMAVDRVQSVIIAPIISQAGCFGVVYGG